MKDGLDYLGRARLQGLVLLVLIFLVGVLAGVAGERLLSRPRPAEPRAEDEGQRPRLPGVFEDMDLTPAQRAAIDSIIASGRPRNEAIVSSVLPRLRAVSDSLHQAIRAVLTPAQVAEFDAYLRAHPPRLVGAPPPSEEAVRPSAAGPPRQTSPGEGARDRRPPPPPGEGPPPPDGNRPPPPDGNPPPPPGGGSPPPPGGSR